MKKNFSYFMYIILYDVDNHSRYSAVCQYTLQNKWYKLLVLTGGTLGVFVSWSISKFVTVIFSQYQEQYA